VVVERQHVRWSVFFTTVYRVYLPTVVAPAELGRGNALLQGSESAAQVGGRGLGGMLAQWLGAAGGLLVDAATFAVSALCLLRIRAPEHRVTSRSSSGTLRREIADGLRWTLADPYLRALATFACVTNLGLTGYQALQVLFLVHDLGANPTVVGAVVACSGIGGILGALGAIRIIRRFGTARGLLLCLLTALPCTVLIPSAFPGPGLLLAAVGNLVPAAGIVAANVIIAAFRQTYPPPPHIRGVSSRRAAWPATPPIPSAPSLPAPSEQPSVSDRPSGSWPASCSAPAP
jgi:predicted MFS family arabinose efflux permease